MEPKKVIDFGLYAIPQPETEWQKKLLHYTRLEKDSIYKPVILWRPFLVRGEPSQDRLHIPGVCRLFYEPVNPLNEEQGGILQAFLYFQSYKWVVENFQPWQVEQALQRFRIEAALLAKKR